MESSASSLGEASSSRSASLLSCPQRRVPLMGWLSTSPRRTRMNRSGEVDTMAYGKS